MIPLADRVVPDFKIHQITCYFCGTEINGNAQVPSARGRHGNDFIAFEQRPMPSNPLISEEVTCRFQNWRGPVRGMRCRVVRLRASRQSLVISAKVAQRKATSRETGYVVTSEDRGATGISEPLHLITAAARSGIPGGCSERDRFLGMCLAGQGDTLSQFLPSDSRFRSSHARSLVCLALYMTWILHFPQVPIPPHKLSRPISF
jgi:hypothetical protein